MPFAGQPKTRVYIWRYTSSLTLVELHGLANTAMRWTISHLHFAVILISHMVRSYFFVVMFDPP